MNAQQTIEKMKMMRLTAMAEMYHQSMSQNMYQELTTDEWMSMLIDHQWEDRPKQENKQPHPQVSNDTKCIGSGHRLYQ